MADKKISQLPVASSIGAADVSVLVGSDTDYQFSFTTLLGFVASNLSVGSGISFGIAIPQNTIGNNGDVFLKTDTASLYQKINGAWALAYTIPTSAAGPDGTLLYGDGIPGATIGADNDSYIDTSTGIFYLRTSGSWAQVFSMATGPQGPQGPQGTAGIDGTNGTNGKTILSGTTNPSNSTDGVDGDYYINLSTYYFFGPKAAGIWPAGFSLITSITSNSYNTPFTAITGLTIMWQTDVVTDTVTYAALFGNTLFTKPTVYAKGIINTDGSYEVNSIDYNLTITLSADASQIIKLTFDWVTPQTGIISF